MIEKLASVMKLSILFTFKMGISLAGRDGSLSLGHLIETCQNLSFIDIYISVIRFISDVYSAPQDINLLRGVSDYIYCSFEGPPQPFIMWYSHASPARYKLISYYYSIKN